MRGGSPLRFAAKLLLSMVALLALHVGLVVAWLLLDDQSDPEGLIARPLPDVRAARPALRRRRLPREPPLP